MAHEYHRYYNSKTPMSDWGHAMFAKGLGLEGAERVSFYGVQHYTFDPKKHANNTVHVEDIIDDIKTYILADIERGWSYVGDFDPVWAEESLDELIASYNPDDIVDAALSWDNPYTMMVAWEVLDKKNKLAILLDDGAIVFDEAMIEQTNEEEELI